MAFLHPKRPCRHLRREILHRKFGSKRSTCPCSWPAKSYGRSVGDVPGRGVVFWGAVPESVAGLRQNGCDEIDGCPTKGLTAWGLSRDRIPEDVFLVSWSDAVHQEEHRAIGLAASVKRSVLTEEMIRLSSSFPSSPSPP